VKGVIAALAVAVAFTAAPPQPASAFTFKTLVTDSFEDPALWTGFYAAPGAARIITNQLGARTGQRYGYLNEGAGTGTWASLERLVPGGGAGWICSASIWYMPGGADFNGHTRFNIEVIDPATFTYVALNPVDLAVPHLLPFQKFTVGAWQSNLPQLLFRVSQLGGDATIYGYLEDLTVSCFKF